MVVSSLDRVEAYPFHTSLSFSTLPRPAPSNCLMLKTSFRVLGWMRLDGAFSMHMHYFSRTPMLSRAMAPE